ncbi:hypothetical protein AU188_24065 [Mycobacterium sp. IS-3022]|nr:hypothetical protein AU188_24065 [Mycobacterium sp. IS-3022]
MENAINALDDESYLVQGTFPIESVLNDAERHARALGARVAERVIVAGDPMKGLLKIADKTGADLIVMGNHQLTGRMSQLIGSISEQVTRRTPTHVLLVH